MARIYRADTMTQLHEDLCRALVFSTWKELDLVTSVDVHLHHVLAQADSMDWEFDLKSMWLTRSRWSMMARQYIDPELLVDWVSKTAALIGLKGRGNSVLRTKVVLPRGGAHVGNKETRRWGSCMISLSYRALPKPQITLHSRTSYVGYLGGLDMSIAWMCARYLAAAMGVDVKQFSFVWYNEAMQFHNFKCLAYMLNHPDPDMRKQFRRILMKPENKLKEKDTKVLETCPALSMSRKWLQSIMEMDADGRHLGMMSYNTYRRIRRRYHTEVLGYEYAQTQEGWSYYKVGDKKGEQKEYFKAYQPLPSVMISELDFTPIGLPLAGLPAVEFEGADDEEDDDE